MHKQENNTDPIDKLFQDGFEDANEEIPDFLIEDILDKIPNNESSPKTEDIVNQTSIPKNSNLGFIKSTLVLSVLANIVLAFLWLNNDEKTITEYKTIRTTDTVYIEKTKIITEQTVPANNPKKSIQTEKDPVPKAHKSLQIEKQTPHAPTTAQTIDEKKEEQKTNISQEEPKTKSEIENPHSLDYFMQKKDSVKGTQLFKEK